MAAPAVSTPYAPFFAAAPFAAITCSSLGNVNVVEFAATAAPSRHVIENAPQRLILVVRALPCQAGRWNELVIWNRTGGHGRLIHCCLRILLEVLHIIVPC